MRCGTHTVGSHRPEWYMLETSLRSYVEAAQDGIRILGLGNQVIFRGVVAIAEMFARHC